MGKKLGKKLQLFYGKRIPRQSWAKIDFLLKSRELSVLCRLVIARARGWIALVGMSTRWTSGMLSRFLLRWFDRFKCSGMP